METIEKRVLDTTFKEEWLAALESGDYVQGIGQLRDDTDQFCCLGVACDLAVKKGLGQWVSVTQETWDDGLAGRWAFVIDEEKFDQDRFHEYHETAVLPAALVDLFGFGDDGGMYEITQEERDLLENDYDSDEEVVENYREVPRGSLMSDNDEGKTFVEIAALIRERL